MKGDDASFRSLRDRDRPAARKAPLSDAPLSEAIAVLSRFLVADATLGETLQRVSEITVEAIPTSEFLGISLLDEQGRATTSIFTDEQAPEIDAAQYAEGNGPCLDAWRDNRVVRIDDMRDAGETYPKFAAAASERGILSTMSMPIALGDGAIGALNMYATTADGFSEADEAVAADLTVATAVVLANSQAYWQAVDLAEGLGEAMKSRAVIEQAKGMLMAHERQLSPDEAFEVLKKASQRENLKLRDIAHRMVDRRPMPLAESG